MSKTRCRYSYAMLKDFLEQKKRTANGDENLMTFRLWNGKSIDLLPNLQTSQGFRVWNQQRKKNTY